ncbi:hypothetical protein ACP26L_19415 [Paenibacillus sp. S-38]
MGSDSDGSNFDGSNFDGSNFDGSDTLGRVVYHRSEPRQSNLHR